MLPERPANVIAASGPDELQPVQALPHVEMALSLEIEKIEKLIIEDEQFDLTSQEPFQWHHVQHQNKHFH